MINYQVSFFELFTLPLGVVIVSVGMLAMFTLMIAIAIDTKKEENKK